MTEKIYNEDVLQTTFDATVISCTFISEDNNYDIVLDKSAFFPEEGGQGSDKGTLNDNPVQHVSLDSSGNLHHILSIELPIGTKVTGVVDWISRFDYMQQHSGEHILSGLVHAHFAYDNVGFHLGKDVTTLDFNGVLTENDLLAMEKLANEAIYSNLPIRILFPDSSELAALTYRSKIEITGQVRLVEIPGIDLCACCAPHVQSTGQIGMLKIINCESHRGGVRLTILCGSRALTYFSIQNQRIVALQSSLSAKPELLLDSVERIKKDNLIKQERINNLQSEILLAHIQALPAPTVKKHALLVENHMDVKAIRDAVNLLCKSYNGYCIIFSSDNLNGYQFIAGSKSEDCTLLAAKLKDCLSMKCGGSREMIQGSIENVTPQLLIEKVNSILE